MSAASGRRVAALVLNSVNHDARVIKEADSLAAAGFDVHIVGIQDRKCDDPVTVRESGVVIHRVKMSGYMLWYRYKAKARSAFGVAVGALFVSLAVVFWDLGIKVDGWVKSLSESFGFSAVVLAGSAIPVLIWSAKRYRRFTKAARIKLGEVAGSRLSASRSSGGIPRPLAVAKSLARTAVEARKFRRLSGLFEPQLDLLAPDAVHCHDLPMLPIGARWTARNPHAALVFDSHELYEEISRMSRPNRFMWRRVLKKYSSSVDRFITINDSIANEHKVRYPELPSALVVKNAAVHSGHAPVRSGLLREAAGVDSDRKVLLYQGGYAPHRGLEDLIRASVGLPKGWVLVMMGWGNIESELRTLARSVDGSGGRIRFIDPAPQPELGQWTSGADLGVIPYENTCLNHWFCSPNKLWEYPIAGVPMLVSPFPELSKVVDDHGVGIKLPEELTAEALFQVLDDLTDEELDSMRAACERYVSVDNWARYAKRLVAMYQELLPVSVS